MEIAGQFDKRWNYPHCLGALDGKHVIVQKPENAVSEYHNYKGTHSIVLLALVDANYRFIWADVGCQGRISDGGVFKNTNFYKNIKKGNANFPPSAALPGRTEQVPYVIVADDAFALDIHLMKPFSTDLNKGSPKRVFNYRLSRARRIVENAFGLIASVFRIFRKPIEIKVLGTVINIVTTCLLLHNFLREQPDAARQYSPPGCFDQEDEVTGEVIYGTWREVTATDNGMSPLVRLPRNPTVAAKKIRDEFKDYFISDAGSVPFQNKYL